jgi:hypothetical protein
MASWLHSTSARADEGFADGQMFGLEFAFGGGWPSSSSFTRRLESFGYERENTFDFRFAFSVEAILLRYLSVLLRMDVLDGQTWRRPSGIGPDDEFVWNNYALGVHVRGFLPTANGRFRAYAQAGVGPSFGQSRLRTRLTEGDQRASFRDLQVRYYVAGLLGFEGLVAEHVGFLVQGGYFYAPVPENRFGDRHRGGGGLLLAGLTAHFGRAR